jgi:hypothetical protein
MKERLESIFDACLEEMKKGRSLGEMLSHYPEDAEALRPLLLLAREISSIPRPEPSDAAVNLALLRVGEAVSRQTGPSSLQRFWRRIGFFRPMIAQALAFFLIAAIAVVGLEVIAAGSLPGDLLYPLKLTTERVQFTLTRSAEGRAELRLAFAEKRTKELIRMAEERLVLDKSLLRELLLECQRALEEAEPVDEDRFALFAVKLRHFADYQGAVLGRLTSSIPATRCMAADQAMEICRRRCEWIDQMIEPSSDSSSVLSGVKCRRWPADCRCTEIDDSGTSGQSE